MRVLGLSLALSEGSKYYYGTLRTVQFICSINGPYAELKAIVILSSVSRNTSMFYYYKHNRKLDSWVTKNLL